MYPDLRILASVHRGVLRMVWRLDYSNRHQEELEARARSRADVRELRRQQWHLERRGFWPCDRVGDCMMWIRGRADRRYCSAACRQAAYRERLAERQSWLLRIQA
jgi:hypothetical protein